MVKGNFSNKITQYLCLIPVFGIVPAVIAIVQQRQLPQVAKASRLGTLLFFIWLASYTATDHSDTIPIEILNGSISSLYFLICIWLMVRLAQDKFPFDQK